MADVRPPGWLARAPRWLVATVVLAVLVAVSAVLRTRQLGGQLWFNEAIANGLASHSLGQLPGVLRNGGSSPLYYVLLHLWTGALGSGEAASRALSLLFALATIPVGGWAAWSLGGRSARAGLYGAILFAFGAYGTRFAQEAQPYALLLLLGLAATTGFVHGFVYRRRGYLWLFAIAVEAMLYTQASAGLYIFGLVVALAIVVGLSEAPARRAILRDAALCSGVVIVVYLPWLPTTIHQIAHDTSPWHYAPILGATVPSQLLGSERVDVTLLVAVLVGLTPLALTRARRRSPEALAIWALIAVPVAGLLLARASTLATPGWVARYFGSMVAPVVLLGALGAARARVVGAAAIVLCVVFLANPGSFAPGHKSDMRDVAGELSPLLHRGDVVAVGQPEQTPLGSYYLPAGLRYVTTAGPVRDPTYMDWSNALQRLRHASPSVTLGAVVATLRPGQQLLYVRPLTEGAHNWREPWTELVRRRSAQWGEILAGDVADGTLTTIAYAPHNYRSACCVASSAVLYRRGP